MTPLTRLLATMALLFGFAAVGPAAFAADGDDKCYETITVVDEEAWTETIEHPAVTETIHHDAVTETTPAIWEVWSPNHTQGPQDYTPDWPVDNPGGEPRGTWQAAAGPIPPGHAGPDGVYQQGGGNSSWFYRQAEKVTVIEEAYDEVVVIEEAWTETIEHPEVSHEERVEVPCDDEPIKPDAIVTETSSTERDCDDEVRVTTTVVTTTDWVLNEAGDAYVKGEPDVDVDTTEKPVKPGVCDKDEPKDPNRPEVPTVDLDCPDLTYAGAQAALADGETDLDRDGDGVACERPIKPVSAPAVPTSVDAGLSGAPVAGEDEGLPLAPTLVVLGLLAIAGGSLHLRYARA